MNIVPGERFHVVPTGTTRRMRWWRASEFGATRGRAWFWGAFDCQRSYDVLAVDGRAASLSFEGKSALARINASNGVWVVNKRVRLGWELVIESVDGGLVAWYSGRRLLPGGTISVKDGAQVDLRRSLVGGWKLQVTDNNQRLVDIRTSGRPSAQAIAITIKSLSMTADQMQLVVLTACVVLILQRLLPPVLQGGS